MKIKGLYSRTVQMNCNQLATFLTDHPGWSPCYRSQPLTATDWQPRIAGVFAPSGQFYRIEAVAKALEMKRG